VICLLNPFSGINVTVKFDACPGVRFTLVALTTIAYSGAETFTLTAVDIDGESFASPP
jgi:hypothetical protein